MGLIKLIWPFNYNWENKEKFNILLVSKGIVVGRVYLIISGKIKKNLIYYRLIKE